MDVDPPTWSKHPCKYLTNLGPDSLGGLWYGNPFFPGKNLNEKSENEVGETNIENEPKCKYVNKVLEILN